MSDSLFLKTFVDKLFESKSKTISDKSSKDLIDSLKKDFDDNRFEKMLVITGWIPDLYDNDSSEETQYSKMIEVLVAEWGRRIGGIGECITIKADHEDVKISIADSAIICDAKSFRLSRSQKAPNPKDMVKPDAFKEWGARHTNSIGGLVTFPSTHDWKQGSVVYRDFSNKDNPIVFLSYRHLALLLHYKNKYQAEDFLKLWDYEKIFPEMLSNIKTNRSKYWDAINKAICSIVSINMEEFNTYMNACDKEIQEAIKDYRKLIVAAKERAIARIKEEVNPQNDLKQLKKEIIELRVKFETSKYTIFIDRIDSFRK